MKTYHKSTIQAALEWARTHIQEIEASTNDLYWKQERIEWQLLLLLDDVVLALHKEMREQAQACIDVNKRISDEIIAAIDARLAERRIPREQEKASPECLAAVDSL